MVTAIVVLTLVVAAAISAAWIMHARTFVPMVRRTVLVNFVQSGNSTLRGVLFSRRGEYLCLKSVAAMHVDGSVVPVDGDVLVERRHILFLQVLPHD